MVEHVLLRVLGGIHELFARILLNARYKVFVQILNKEVDISGESASAVLAIQNDLAEQLEVLHITRRVYLGKFKVVHLLNHSLELLHELEHLSFFLDALLSEHAFKAARQIGRGELVLC